MKKPGFFIYFALVLGLVFFLNTGCGKKGMPRPPHAALPSAVCDLSIIKEDDSARLTWSRKGCTPGGQVDGFKVYVYREKADKEKCQECPVDFEQIATVHIGKPNLWSTTSGKAVHVEPIKKGFRYIFKVKAFGPGGESMDSEYVSVE